MERFFQDVSTTVFLAALIPTCCLPRMSRALAAAIRGDALRSHLYSTYTCFFTTGRMLSPCQCCAFFHLFSFMWDLKSPASGDSRWRHRKTDLALRINTVKHRSCNLLNGSKSLVWLEPCLAMNRIFVDMCKEMRCTLCMLRWAAFYFLFVFFYFFIFSCIHHLVWAHDECKSKQRSIWTGATDE